MDVFITKLNEKQKQYLLSKLQNTKDKLILEVEVQKALLKKEKELNTKHQQEVDKMKDFNNKNISKLKDEINKKDTSIQNNQKELELKIAKINQEKSAEINDLKVKLNSKIKEQEFSKNNLTLEIEKMQVKVERKLNQEHATKLIEQNKKITEEYNKEKQKLIDKNTKYIELIRSGQDSKTLGHKGERDLRKILHNIYDINTMDSIERHDKNKNVDSKKADFLHTVKIDKEEIMGLIMYESKVTNAWGKSWISKLVTDLDNEKSHLNKIAILVANTFSNQYLDKIIEIYNDNLIICDLSSVVIASKLARRIIKIRYESNNDSISIKEAEMNLNKVKAKIDEWSPIKARMQKSTDGIKTQNEKLINAISKIDKDIINEINNILN